MRDVRTPSCAGTVYPDDPVRLRSALDGWLALPGRATRAGPPRKPVRLLVAPHIDYARGARGYARAYAALAATDAELFVVFGTAHETPPHLFTVTRRHYATPLGRVATDRAVVGTLAAELGAAEVLADERCHEGEHSVELQLVVLRHLVRRPFTVLPVLCSSISHLPSPARFTDRFFSALARAVRGRRACFIAGADLAHVGPLYGDRRPLSAAEVAAIEAADRSTLAHVIRGDPEAFHRAAVHDDARRRLCGTAPIYAAMRASGRGGALLHYERWTDGRDSVSFAAAAG